MKKQNKILILFLILITFFVNTSNVLAYLVEYKGSTYSYGRRYGSKQKPSWCLDAQSPSNKKSSCSTELTAKQLERSYYKQIYLAASANLKEVCGVEKISYSKSYQVKSIALRAIHCGTGGGANGRCNPGRIHRGANNIFRGLYRDPDKASINPRARASKNPGAVLIRDCAKKLIEFVKDCRDTNFAGDKCSTVKIKPKVKVSNLGVIDSAEINRKEVFLKFELTNFKDVTPVKEDGLFDEEDDLTDEELYGIAGDHENEDPVPPEYGRQEWETVDENLWVDDEEKDTEKDQEKDPIADAIEAEVEDKTSFKISRSRILTMKKKKSKSSIESIWISSSYSEDINDYQSYTYGDNVFELFPDAIVRKDRVQSLTFYVAIKIKTPADLRKKKDCNNRIWIDATYEYPKYNRVFYCGGSGNTQGFTSVIMVDGGWMKGKKTFKTNVNLCQQSTTCDSKLDVPLVCEDNANNSNGTITRSYKEGYDRKGNLNIKECILENEDKKNNSYALKDPVLDNNEYCSVYCKEDVDFTLPYKRQTYNGRYFDIPIAIKGTQSCYTTELDIEQFKTRFDACTTDECRQKEVNMYNSCIPSSNGWNFNYTFEPDLTYEYGESCKSGGKKFMSLLKADDNKYISAESVDYGIEQTYCFDDINDDYSCKSASSNANRTTSYKGYNITTAKFVKVTQTKEGKYDTKRIYYTNNSNGQIELYNDTGAAMLVDGLPVSYDTPTGKYYYKIKLNNIGTFYDKNEVGRIFGEESNSISDGRSTTAPADVCNPEQEFNDNAYGCSYSVNQDHIICIDKDGNEVSLDDCDKHGFADTEIDLCKEKLCPFCTDESTGVVYQLDDCIKENYLLPDGKVDKALCRQKLCGCPECRITCVGICCTGVCVNPKAAYAQGPLGIKIKYRTVSRSSLMPNEESIGANWDVKNNNPIISDKARETILKIEDSAKKYDKLLEDKANKITEDLQDVEDYTFKVTLTPSLIQRLKEINQEQGGNYGNSTLKCYDYDFSHKESKDNFAKLENGQTKSFVEKFTKALSDRETCKAAGYTWINDPGKCIMDNIFCYSTLLDELFTQYKSNFDLDIMQARENSKTTALYNMSIIKEVYNSVVMSNEYFSIYTASTFDITRDGLPDAGPSWK